MNLNQLDIKKSYISYGENDIATSLINPALKVATMYKRSVGFFSSSVFETIIDGVMTLVRNGGRVQLIASPNLSEKDIDAITFGYEFRQKIIEDRFNNDFTEAIESLNDKNLRLLVELIAKGIIDIKIAVTRGIGMYHDKLGIVTDTSNNSIVFYGSSNSSLTAYKYNYEKIRVVCSWNEAEKESVQDEIEEFDGLWAGTNQFVEVSDFSDAAQKSLLHVLKNRSDDANKVKIKLRDYQENAIKFWKNNGYNGFYVMATGTGKTWTAIFSAKELLKEKKAIVVICAPYKHLIKQWAEDLQRVFFNTSIILVSSENSKWDRELTEGIIKSRYDRKFQVIVISTIKSFNMERFENIMLKYEGERLLIVDEAHRFTKRPSILKDKYQYMLGLSATPNNGKNISKGEELLNFFGGVVYSLPIEEALDRDFLVPYSYYPIFVEASEEEEMDYMKYTAYIASCFKNGTCINQDKLFINIRNRLRVISMATQKIDQIEAILNKVKESDHFVVYCGDGRLYDNEKKELRHIQFIKRKLNERGYKTSQFTARENMATRMQLVDSFNKNEISALAAIRCLDEGINIPSIKSALILSSNDDYKEFVQRRGRILRKYKDKESANIYDVIVLPSLKLKSMAEIELRRYFEFAKLAVNKDELLLELQILLDEYCLNEDDITINKDLVQEDTFDE